MPTDQPLAQPTQTRELDPTATEFNGAHFALFDLYRANLQAGASAVIEGRTFTNCVIEGPALMLIQDGNLFEGTNFGPSAGDMRNMLFRSLSGNMAVGAIPVRNCIFRNCQFHALGITGADDVLRMLTEQVVTSG